METTIALPAPERDKPLPKFTPDLSLAIQKDKIEPRQGMGKL